MKGWWFRVAALGVASLILLAGEGVLRIVVPELGAMARQFRINAQKTDARQYSVVKEPDPYLLWHLKPGAPIFQGETLNSRGFRSPEFTTDKTPGTRRIVVIGDSRSFGFGVPDRTHLYADRMAAFLNHLTPNTPVEVINLSVIGYSSFQGRRLMDTLVRDLAPDIVIAWFGFNDLLYYHIMDHDAAAARFTRAVRDGLNQLYLFHGLQRLVWKYAVPADRPIAEDQPIVRRVPAEHYRENLLDIVRKSRRIGAQPILMTTPVRPRIPLVLNSKKRIVTAGDGHKTAHLVTQYEFDSFWLMDATEFPGTEEALRRLLDQHPDIAILHYFMGLFNESRGDAEAAAESFLQAARLDDTRGTVDQYNKIVRDVARESDATLVDLVPIFSNYNRYGLFVDDCHPGSNGHGVIASQVIGTITGIPSQVVEHHD
ncbi:SGNH/GDSL hydrolase family protein [bacterium]|nr:SGNH/GDSL hydrolase family protein [candidate division CSSED10-310 bacterium]